MNTFRQILFWLHLAAGLIAGVVIFIMCVTGALLAFERQTIEWVERDARYVAVRSEPKLGAAEVLAKVIEAKPEAKPASIAIKNEPGAAWEISLGREGVVFADPYTGAITGESNKKVREVMSKLREWHRYVALSGDQRPAGKAMTGAGNLLFLFLAISGIYIWFPRNLVWKAIKPVIWFRSAQRGKARNFNWHNTIGFWTSLFLIVFTLTATVISYQWASNLLYTLTGNEVPAPQGGRGGQQQEQAEAFTIPTTLGAAWTRSEQQSAAWKSISLRLPANESCVFTIDEGIYWNIFGRSTLTVDTASGEVKKWDPYGERNSAVQLRSWFRFTHTGETGGTVGQIIGLIACVGGAFLVWTGFSLAFRRFGNWLKRRRNVAEAV
ncbi:MAG TPA: PepSY-associated TM helix domain-containing protein [Pyrinomonadaceae bacterium]|nr:PepSY-associated TM helix domain-containing protein [Pyrinomonadaceae bacterium]